MPGTSINQQVQSGLTQVGGAEILDLDVEGREHQLVVEIVGTPTAGVLAVSGRPPGGSLYADIGGTIDMVNGPFIYRFSGRFDSLTVTPTGFNGTSYGVILTSDK